MDAHRYMLSGIETVLTHSFEYSSFSRTLRIVLSNVHMVERVVKVFAEIL